MKFKKINKNDIFVIIIIFFLVVSYFFLKEKDDFLKEKRLLGKIVDNKVFNKCEYYLVYKYSFKNKTYKGYKKSNSKSNFLIGECFEVIIDETNPKKSKLNLNKQQNCKD
jgi:hypothetical protein